MSSTYRAKSINNIQCSQEIRDKILKPTNCVFCEQDVRNCNLEEHLESNESCKKNYLEMTNTQEKDFKTTTIK